jgi:hypothetical protein
VQSVVVSFLPNLVAATPRWEISGQIDLTSANLCDLGGKNIGSIVGGRCYFIGRNDPRDAGPGLRESTKKPGRDERPG